MAHPTQRARQRSKAIDDLRASCARLAERFDLVAPEIPERFTKDPSHLPTLQLEAVTAFLNTLSATERDGESGDESDAIDVAPNVVAPTVAIATRKRKSTPTQGRATIRA